MGVIRRQAGSIVPVKQQRFITAVDQRMDAFAEHRGAACQQRGGKLGDRHEQGSEQSRVKGPSLMGAKRGPFSSRRIWRSTRPWYLPERVGQPQPCALAMAVARYAFGGPGRCG